MPERAQTIGSAWRRHYDRLHLHTDRYRHQLERLLGDTSGLLDGSGRPRASGRETALAGLYLCGFFVAPTGMLREIGREARVIAEDIARRMTRRPQTKA